MGLNSVPEFDEGTDRHGLHEFALSGFRAFDTICVIRVFH